MLAGSRGRAAGSMRYNDTTRYAVVMIVSPYRHHDALSTQHTMLFKECDVTTTVSNAAPHSCHHAQTTTL